MILTAPFDSLRSLRASAGSPGDDRQESSRGSKNPKAGGRGNPAPKSSFEFRVSSPALPPRTLAPFSFIRFYSRPRLSYRRSSLFYFAPLLRRRRDRAAPHFSFAVALPSGPPPPSPPARPPPCPSVPPCSPFFFLPLLASSRLLRERCHFISNTALDTLRETRYHLYV